VRVLDLYCGMGGLSLGVALAVEDIEIRGIDIDGHAVETYNLNLSRFGCRAERTDLLAWELDGEYDIVVGGPPCQPFSIANTIKMGEVHPLFPTFRRYFELVRAARPVAFVFENVKGLLTHKFRSLLNEQLKSLSSEYRIRYAVLNAAHYGVPQRRERLIAVGVRRDLGIRPSLPESTHAEAEASTLTRRLYRWLTVQEAIGDLLETPPIITHIAKTSRDMLLPLGKPALAILSDGRLRPDGHHDSLSQSCIYRRLTVRECMRLQSFPDWWRFPGSVSVSKRYKLVGEAVPPILAYRILIALGKVLGFSIRESPHEEDWGLPYFRRAFADYFDGVKA
jgi:DNA (cytosine-5)-methyltransferase 1